MHDRDMKNMKKSLSNWKGVPTATVKTLKPALQQTTNAALVVGKKTRTDLVPALGQAWTAAEPFVRRAGTAVVGLMADGAAFAIDAMEDFRDAIKRKRAKRKKLLGLPFSHPARKQRRSRYDRAAEISEKITDGAEIAGAVALNTSKVATRWLGKAGKAVGKAAGRAGFETPTKVVLISELWTPDNDLLTAAMKLKRKPIVDKHKAAITGVYV